MSVWTYPLEYQLNAYFNVFEQLFLHKEKSVEIIKTVNLWDKSNPAFTFLCWSQFLIASVERYNTNSSEHFVLADNWQNVNHQHQQILTFLRILPVGIWAINTIY